VQPNSALFEEGGIEKPDGQKEEMDSGRDF
jgi:hypothetical protein